MSIHEFFDFEHTLINIAFFAVLFFICWNLENIFGVTTNYKKWKHSAINFWFIIPGGILQGILGYYFLKFILIENSLHYGVIKYNTITQLVVVFIVLDLAYYVYHVIMHKFKKIWRFHAIHHSDTVLNVSTCLREHPVETIIRLGQYMVFSLLIGPAFWIIALHQFIQIASKIIIHSNFRLHDKVDKYLSYLILTPNMHHVHHHYKMPYTDSNYGDLFSIWDRLFGTFTYLPKEDVQFGLDAVNDKQAGNIKDLFTTKIFRNESKP